LRDVIEFTLDPLYGTLPNRQTVLRIRDAPLGSVVTL
jgi:hypothetical protein